MGVDEPPDAHDSPRGEPRRRETPWDHAPRPRAAAPGQEATPDRPVGLSRRAKVAAAVFVAVLYAGGMGFRGDWLPGIVGGVLAGVVLVMVLNRIEQRRRRR